MPDLESSITDWRRQMRAAGIKTPVPLEELESHLRDEIEQQTRSGLNAREAFHSAIQKIGEGKVLKSEFKRIGGIFENEFMKKFKPVIYVAGAHYLLWWALWGVLSLPHFGFHLIYDQSGFGETGHPLLYAFSYSLICPFYFLSLPIMWLWNWFGGYSSSWWLGWLFAPPLNSLIWGGIFGGLWIVVRQKAKPAVQ
jgi:hypothetical protein